MENLGFSRTESGRPPAISSTSLDGLGEVQVVALQSPGGNQSTASISSGVLAGEVTTSDLANCRLGSAQILPRIARQVLVPRRAS